MAELTIVIGANGAGKSTWCRSNNILLLDNSGVRARVVAQVAGQEAVRRTDPLPRWSDDLVARIEGDRDR